MFLFKNLKKSKLNSSNNNNNNHNIPGTVIKCENINHDNDNNYYCKNCLYLFCKYCSKEHSNHETSKLKDIRSTLNKELVEYNSQIQEVIEEKQLLKQTNTDEFNSVVEGKYNQQVENITKQFRNLHDLLHFKEVELKRELRSYHDENVESFTTLLSKFEHEIEEYKNYIQKSSTTPNNNTVSNDLADQVGNNVDDRNLKEFINHRHHQFTSTTKPDKPDSYSVYVFNENQGNNEINSIALNKHISVRQNLGKNNFHGYRKDRYIYYFSKNAGLERIMIQEDGTIGKLESIIKYDQNSPNVLSYFWNETFANGKLFLFSSNKLFTIDTLEESPKWNSVPFKCTAYDLASIYDGQDHVYVFYGYNQQEDRKVKKLNIHTLETTIAVEEFDNLSYLNLAVHENSIFLIGGYNERQSWKNGISRLDLKTSKIEIIMPIKDQSISGGCFVPPLNSFFCFTWGSQFFRYDVTEKTTTTITQISQPKNVSANYSKLYFDGNDTIHMVIVNINTLYSYHINDDLWTYQTLHFKEPIASSSFFTITDV